MKAFSLLTILVALFALCGITYAQDHTAVGDSVAATVNRASEGVHTVNMVNVKVIRDGKVIYDYTSHNLKTTGGIDCIASAVSNTGTQCAAAKYIALSTDSTAIAAGDCAAGSSACTLTSEVTTSGLARAAATYAHTSGTSTYTLTASWTATAAVSNVQKAAVFNASSSGTMVFENTFTAVSLNSGDQIQITWTVTIS